MKQHITKEGDFNFNSIFEDNRKLIQMIIDNKPWLNPQFRELIRTENRNI